MAEITPDKLELLRTALPKGLSAGDSGLAGFPEKPSTQPMSWPQFQATTTDTKLYTGSPAITETPQTIQSQAAEETLHPWAIYSSTDSNGDTIVKIELNSRVYKGTGTYDNIAVTGLDSWIPPQEGYVILNGTVLNNEITNLSITWGDDGSTERATFNTNNEQTRVTIRLAYLYQEEESWRIRQDVFGQLTAITTCYDAKPTICFIQT